MNTQPIPPRQAGAPPKRVVDLELLAIDLSRCTRCVGTLANIETAVRILQPVLEATGIDVQVRKVRVESEEQARQHRLVSSPTVRIDGQEIVTETLESQCETCTDLCNCEAGTACRVWRYRGQEFTEAPVGLLIEALLRAIVGTDTRAAAASADFAGVPENLRRFFAGVERRPGSTPCCAASEKEECCAPEAKAACCDTPDTGACGCG